jgi:tRNA (guanine-N7-)-methyltransferase
MKILDSILDQQLIETLKNGGLAVFKSDTIYGIFSLALSLEAYQNLIRTRPKSPGKHYIVLISGKQDALDLGISESDFNKVSTLWPASVTVVMKTNNAKLNYLANKDGQIGVRIAADKNLRRLIRKTGPLLAPSANPEGQIPASNIKQAIDYFGDAVQIYVDAGEVSISQKPSTVINIEDGQLNLIREGVVPLNLIKDKLKLCEPYKKRKLHKFNLFASSPICFEAEEFKFGDISPGYQKINLEVGSGTAELSLSLASKYPDQLFIASDVKADRLVQGAIKAQQLNLNNIIFLRSNVANLLNLISENSIDNIWITFPDPMPKDRQAKHRLTNSSFLKIYKQLLKKDGKVLFKTDDAKLFNYSLEQIEQASGQILNLSSNLHKSDLSEDYKFKTTYEDRFLNEGKAINFVKFKL